jgi:predicted lipoprotein with Yx(FWY)xxD motif
MTRRTLPAITTAITLALALVGAALAQAATPVVQVRYDAALGHFLTDDAGMTLYVFSNDEPGVSNCSGNCAVNWPPVLVGEASLITAPLAIPAGFATTTRADGGVQLTYGGWPLYGWVNDAAPGDTTGQGVGGNWWVANLNPVVRVATHPSLGEILVGPTGMTLYTFRNDADGMSNCNGNCAANWPPLVGGFTETGVMPGLGEGAGGDVALFERADGGMQVVLDGMPLYYWRNDFVPGDATGDGVGGNWDVARP